VHLYLHVPFCARRCSYCDFAIAVRKSVPSSRFAETVVAEWRHWLGAPWWAAQTSIDTVYFGGGTPSLLDPDAIGVVLQVVGADHVITAGAEITIEANPEDVTPERAAAWADSGVNRVSVGVQSFSPAVLEWMHRTHGPERPAAAIRTLRQAGIANVSIDLIYAVPRALGRSWRDDLDRGLALEPSHLSLYGLTVEDRTPLGRWVARGEAVPTEEAPAAEEYLEAHEALTGAGYGHYEVSNAGKPGFESRHNWAYWRRATYLGLGPSAHSAVGGRRWWNVRDWEGYRRAIGAGSGVAGEEALDDRQIRLEGRYLGLRTREGVPASSLPVGLVDQWVSAGWAGRDGSRVVLTVEGWLRLDTLVSQVDEA
jgi:oxygen-independent coproporphyrinogen-3 oxidase